MSDVLLLVVGMLLGSVTAGAGIALGWMAALKRMQKLKRKP